MSKKLKSLATGPIVSAKQNKGNSSDQKLLSTQNPFSDQSFFSDPLSISNILESSVDFVSDDRNAVDITPRTSLLDSLRNNSLSNEEAIGDLVDNALDMDVNATKIHIGKSPKQIIIADNGSGMTKDVLMSAMKLGPAQNSTPTDLGLFGIGLKNAPTSLGRKFTVLTKHAEDKYVTAVYDLDAIVASKDFKIPLDYSNDSEIKLFNDLNGNSPTGTSIIIEKLDRITLHRDHDFTTNLKKYLGEVFRIFIRDGKEIYVNGTKLVYRDVMKATYTNEETEINDQYYTFHYPEDHPIKPNGEFKIRIRIGFFPVVLEGEKNKHGISLSNQGFYVMRNDRQLMRNTWLGLFAYHAKFNRSRGEIFFNGEQDDVFAINYEKNKIEPKKWFTEQLKKQVGGIFASHEERIKTEILNRRVKDSNEEIHERIKKEIDAKANRIAPLKVAVSSKRIRKVQFEAEIDIHKKGKAAVNHGNENGKGHGLFPTENEEKKKRELVDFAVENLSASFICRFEDQGNGALRIVWNANHPFYPFYINLEENTQAAFSKLLFALGRAVVVLSNKSDWNFGMDWNANEKPVVYQVMDDFQIMMGDEFRKLMD